TRLRRQLGGGFGASLLIKLSLTLTRWTPGTARTIPRQRLLSISHNLAQPRPLVNRQPCNDFGKKSATSSAAPVIMLPFKFAADTIKHTRTSATAAWPSGDRVTAKPQRDATQQHKKDK